MNIRRITSNINHFIRTKRIERAEKEISAYVKVQVSNIEAHKQISNARSTIANYAKNRGISVDIFDAVHSDDVKKAAKNPLSDKMIVLVKNLLTDKQTHRLLSTDTNAVVNYSNFGINAGTVSKISGKDGIGIEHFCHEDGFLRNLYRNIAEMTDSLTGKITKNK